MGNHRLKPCPPPRNPPMELSARIKFGKQVIKWHTRSHLLGPFHLEHPIVKECRPHPTFGVAKPDGNIRGVINLSKEMYGECLNDYLREGPMASVEYITLIQLIYILTLIGPSAWIWAKDLDEGFYNVRVQQDQIKQMAFVFASLVFIPLVLAMGLTTAPFIFTAFMWHVVAAMRLWDKQLTFIEVPLDKFEKSFFPQQNDLVFLESTVMVPLINYYLDDIFGFGKPSIIWKQYEMAQRVLQFLGLNANIKKDRTPAIKNILLGVEYLADTQQIQTPWEKATKYIELANQILSGHTVKKRLLFSLTGKARHIAIHCKPLAAFACGVEIYGFKGRDNRQKPIEWHHNINITSDLRKDIEFLIWGINKAAHFPIPFEWLLHPKESFQFTAYTDAAGVYGGIGGFIAQKCAPHFQLHWDLFPRLRQQDIQWQEMAAIYVLLRTNYLLFRGKYVHFWSDNEPVVWMLIKCRAKKGRNDLQWMIRRIAAILIENSILPYWDHIPGEQNKIADALSRFLDEPFKNTVHNQSYDPGFNQNESAFAALKELNDYMLLNPINT